MTLGLKTIALTLLALTAFASNSLLTRLALGSNRIDAATFTCIRLVSGAVMLTLLIRMRKGNLSALGTRSMAGAFALFVYAAPFSFAYLRIGAAVGALVLFGVVQLTMIGYGIYRGERPTLLAWAGLMLALIGLAILTVPSATRPDPLGLVLMAVAGVAWGTYSLTGRTARDPIAANAQSFIWASAPAVVLALLLYASAATTAWGITLAVISGAVTSGLGYAVWYRALPGLSVTQAAVAQLSVPVIAAIGAAAFLHETLTARLLIAGAAVLGGVALVLTAKSQKRI